MKYFAIITLIAVAVLYFSFTTIGNNKNSNNQNSINQASKAKVTFVELGSVNCIPCKQMQPVMKAIEKKYGDQVKVIFYDVWKEDQKKYAKQYGIKLIPTQVFLDSNGKEFHRHEGFYPETEIDKILQGKGLKQKKN
ncbi:MAG: thioredoxin family protein [Ignavibacteriales bacterium]|nr:thioredoxin family protein [Ignavibacteriales bacterium]